MVDREASHGALTDLVRGSVAEYGIGDMLCRLTHEVVTVPDYYGVASANGCQAVLGVPMGVGETSVGALNIYQRRVHPWRDDELEAARLLAEMASWYILNLRRLTTAQQLVGQLQAALDSRVVIEQAKGIVATRRDVDMAVAFDLIRQHARDRDRKLHDVAGEIVSGDLEP